MKYLMAAFLALPLLSTASDSATIYKSTSEEDINPYYTERKRNPKYPLDGLIEDIGHEYISVLPPGARGQESPPHIGSGPKAPEYLGSGGYAGTDRQGLIIGADDRAPVSDTSRYPYSSVVHISYTRKDEIKRCSGALVGPDLVLTAGHCVHSGGVEGVWHEKVVVYPGRDGGMLPYGSCEYKDLFALSGWVREKSYYYDLGGIKLNCAIGEQASWLGFFWRLDPRDNEQTTRLVGYPIDKASIQQWQTYKPVFEATGELLLHRHDTVGGTSGAPLIYRNYPGPGYWVGGVHSTGDSTAQVNRAVRINERVFNMIAHWKTL